MLLCCRKIKGKGGELGVAVSTGGLGWGKRGEMRNTGRRNNEYRC